MKIKGITVTLWDKVKTGVDELRQPIYEEIAEEVENVLVAPVTDEEIVDTLNLTGKHAVYQLAIPKGDEHTWTNRRISFFGSDWKAIGAGSQGIEANIPGEWNMKMKVEKYD